MAREQAVQIGQKLMDCGYFKNVNNEHQFEDTKIFYQQVERDMAAANTQIQWNRTPNLSPYDLSVEILNKILAIYKDNSGLIAKFGLMAMSSLSLSEEFADFCLLACELQKINLKDLKEAQKFPFWVNIYNAILLHSNVNLKAPLNTLQRISFFKSGKYQIGTHSFSLLEIEHAILRGKLTRPDVIGSNLLPKYNKKDERFELIVEQEPLVSFALCAGTKSSPPIRVYTEVDVKKQLLANAKEFLKTRIRMFMNEKEITVFIPKILHWYSADFGGNEKTALKNIVDLLPDAVRMDVRASIDSGAPLKVKADEYSWDFLYPVSMEVST